MTYCTSHGGADVLNVAKRARGLYVLSSTKWCIYKDQESDVFWYSSPNIWDLSHVPCVPSVKREVFVGVGGGGKKGNLLVSSETCIFYSI